MEVHKMTLNGSIRLKRCIILTNSAVISHICLLRQPEIVSKKSPHARVMKPTIQPDEASFKVYIFIIFLVKSYLINTLLNSGNTS